MSSFVKKIWIIWIAFAYAVILYPILAFFLQAKEAENGLFFTVFFIVLSVAIGVASIFVYLFAIVRPLQAGKFDLKTQEGLNKLLSVFIITWAFAETIAVFGMVVVLMNGHSYYAIPFSIVSLTLLIIFSPRIGSYIP